MATGSRKRSWPFWVGGALVLVAGVAAFAFLLVTGIVDLAGSMVRGVVPGAIELPLREPGTYTVYHEYVSDFGGKVYRQSFGSAGLQCRVTSKADGSEVPLRVPFAHETYSVGSREGQAIYEFTIDKPGDYELTGEAGEESVLAVSRGLMGGAMGIVLRSVGVCSLTAVLGLGLLVFALVRTIRNRRAAREAAAVGTAPPGFGGGPPA